MSIMDYIGQNMTPLVPLMALTWFVVGILVGQRMQLTTGARSEERGGRFSPVELYVGNLPFAVTDKDLEEEFRKFGRVTSSRIIKNGFSGKSKGFGFVVMPERAEAEAAMKRLNQTKLRGREIVVNLAKAKSED